MLETQVTEKNAPNIRTAIKEGDRDGCGERRARELMESSHVQSWDLW